MSIQFQKTKNYNLKLMLTCSNKSKKIFKKIGSYNFKTYSLNINYVPYILKNGGIVSNSFFKILNSIKTKGYKKIKYK
jgi:hypothetical protein